MPKNMLQLCGQAVDGLVKKSSISNGLYKSGNFCTNFVRSMWVSFGSYKQLILPTSAQLFIDFPSVNLKLYPLSTWLTNKVTFSTYK